MSQQPKRGLLVVIAGPTASGKTSLAVKLAQYFDTEVISADSRQFYHEIPIGTAAPTISEREGVVHHFVGQLSIFDDYNVSKYELEVLNLLDDCFQKHQVMILVGGSGLYIDAVCHGIDQLPDPDPELRKKLNHTYEETGIQGLQNWLKDLDPDYFSEVDSNNKMRLMRGIEVCIQTGKPYSQQRLNRAKQRCFDILKIGMLWPRQLLVERIHQRTDEMLNVGWLQEIQSVFPFRHLNALNTVGYKELFACHSGEWEKDFAIEKIKTNTRRYAKRQMTWLRRDKEVNWIDASNRLQSIADAKKMIEDKLLNKPY